MVLAMLVLCVCVNCYFKAYIKHIFIQYIKVEKGNLT